MEISKEEFKNISDLSALSVDKINTIEVKKILSNFLQNIEIEEDLIPDIYKLNIKKK